MIFSHFILYKPCSLIMYHCERRRNEFFRPTEKSQKTCKQINWFGICSTSITNEYVVRTYLSLPVKVSQTCTWIQNLWLCRSTVVYRFVILKIKLITNHDQACQVQPNISDFGQSRFSRVLRWGSSKICSLHRFYKWAPLLFLWFASDSLTSRQWSMTHKDSSSIITPSYNHNNTRPHTTMAVADQHTLWSPSDGPTPMKLLGKPLHCLFGRSDMSAAVGGRFYNHRTRLQRVFLVQLQSPIVIAPRSPDSLPRPLTTPRPPKTWIAIKIT